MKATDRTRLGHIKDFIDAIREYSAIGRQAFMASRLHQDAVVRNFEIIGEASNHLSAEFRETTQGSWQQLKAFRNFLAHQYMCVDTALVWNIVVNDLPALEEQVDRLLAE